MTFGRFFKRFTKDRDTRDPPGLQQIMTVEQIGPRRSLTPEGFLLCEGVPIARIGVMLYGPGETPVEVGHDGAAYVSRSADELFKPECLASFVGKPVVDEHPEADVTPDNWAKLARGVAFNIRQGTGEDADVILADLLITDARMIRDIEAMKREVSAGYEADYEQTGDGQGVQTNIIGNHIALVERGRCGPRCAIGDHSYSTSRKEIMATQTRHATGKPVRRKIAQATLDALMEQLGGGDPDASTMDDGELSSPADSHTHIHIHGMGSTAATSAQGAGVVNSTGAGGAGASNDDAGGEGGGNAGAADPKTEARFASLENGHKEILTQIAALAAAIKGASGEGGSGGEDPTGDADEDDDDDKTEDADNPFEKKKEGEGSRREIVAGLEKAMRESDKKSDEKKDDKSKTKDSAALETSYKETLSGCEVLVPGFKMATFDAKAKRTATIDTMCASRRKALDAFAVTVEGQQIVESISGVKTVDTAALGCQDVAVLFRAAVGAKKLLNNGNATRDAGTMATSRAQSGAAAKKAPASLADLNKLYREHYAAKDATTKH